LNKAKIRFKRPLLLSICGSMGWLLKTRGTVGVVATPVADIWDEGVQFTREGVSDLIPSAKMAPLGHSATQDPQPMQIAGLIVDTRPTVMASTGQT
jgi:hypothetical protein